MGSIQRLIVKGLPTPIGRYYCHVVKAGNHVFVSGVTGRAADGKIASPDVAVQAQKALDNIATALEAVGARPEQIVKVTVYMRNADDWQKVRPVREKFFGEHPPASTLVEVSRLVLPEALIEVDAVAYVG